MKIPINIQRFANGSGVISGTDNGSLRGQLYYEYTQNVANNTTTITFYVQAAKTSNTTSVSSGSKAKYSLSTEGISAEATANIYPKEFKLDKSHWETIYSTSYTYKHADNGTKSINVSGYVQGPTASSLANNKVSFSGSINFPTIPRYANITSFTVNPVSETSLQVYWGVDVACNAIWYSIDNGKTWVQTSGSPFTISGLTANTSYNIKIRVRRSDSNLTTDSGTYTQSTYQYPYITGITSPNLQIGQSQTIKIYNPLKRNVTVYMKKNNASGAQIYSATTTGTSVTFTPNTDTLYSNVLNDEIATCVYYCTYSNHTVQTISGSYNCIAPKLKSNLWDRPTSTGTTITKTKIAGSFYAGKLNNVQNTLSIKYRYKDEGANFSNYINICSNLSATNANVKINSNNTFEVLQNISIPNRDYKKNCTIEIVVSDSKVSNTYTITIPKGTPVWWWTEDYFGISEALYIGNKKVLWYE